MPGFIHHFFLPFFQIFTGPPMLENKPMHFLNHHDAKITYGRKKVEIFVEMSTSAWKKTPSLTAGRERRMFPLPKCILINDKQTSRGQPPKQSPGSVILKTRLAWQQASRSCPLQKCSLKVAKPFTCVLHVV